VFATIVAILQGRDHFPARHPFRAVKETMLVSESSLFGGLTRKQGAGARLRARERLLQVPKRVTTEEWPAS